MYETIKYAKKDYRIISHKIIRTKKKRAARFSNNCTVKTHFLLNTINKVMGYVKTKSKRKFKGEEEDG